MDGWLPWVLGAIAVGMAVLGLLSATPLRIVEPPPRGELGLPARVVLTGLPEGARAVIELRDALGRVLGRAAAVYRGGRAEAILYYDLPSTAVGTLEVSVPRGAVLRRPVRFPGTRGTWVKVFFFDREGRPFPAVRRIPHTPRVATEAVRALLAGPTLAEEGAGVWSAAPAGVRLLSIHISAGTAEVTIAVPDPDAPCLELLSLQLRETLLQFPTVSRAEIRFVAR